ncbi:MAG: hypothetical protein ACJAVV_002456 [Alphaproteobacteria bacterium]|jgi:hypothetical protein
MLIIGAYPNLSLAKDAVVVVTNIDNTELSLSKQEVRILFNTKVVGLTEARIQSYWAQMRFSGRKKPPKQLDDEKIVLLFLSRNKGAVAYMSANQPIQAVLTVVYASK